MGHSAEKNSRAEFFNTCCVSVNPNCMSFSSIALGQSQDKVAHDIALNFRSAGLNSIAARAQPGVGPLAVVEGKLGSVRQLAVGAEQFHSHLLEALIQFAPKNLLNRTFGAGLSGFDHAADGAHLVQAHDFDFGVALREFLADDRVLRGGPAVAFDGASQVEKARELALESNLETRAQQRAFVHERAQSHVPTIVDAAD